MIHRSDIIHAARSLRWIFWGALLVLLDIIFSMTFGEIGFRLDLLDDTPGMLLIIAAVGPLRGIGMGGWYATRMVFVHWVAIIALLDSVVQHFIFPKPWLLAFVSLVLPFVMIGSMLVLCVCMRDVCQAATLSEAARKWQRAFVLFLIFNGIPSILLVMVAPGVLAVSLPAHVTPTPGMLWIGLLFLVPAIYFFSATSTMARAAEEMPPDALRVALLARATAMPGKLDQRDTVARHGHLHDARAHGRDVHERDGLADKRSESFPPSR